MVTSSKRAKRQPVPPPADILDFIDRTGGQVELLLTLTETCYALRCSEPLVLEAMESGDLIGRRFGKNKLMFLASDVRQYNANRPSWRLDKAAISQ